MRKAISLALLWGLWASGAAQAQIGARVAGWTMGADAAASPEMRMGTMGDVTNALPFIGVTPCRIVDTRGPAGPYGAPSLAAASPRNFALLGGPCAGLPGGVAAYSLNVTVTNTLGAGFIKIYPQGGASPVVSTLNYLANQTVANAAIVPAGTGGGITVVAGVAGADLILDIDGYFPNGSATMLLNPGERFEVAGIHDTLAILAGRNDSTADGALAVSGIAGGPTGGTIGVQGRSNGGAGSLGVLGFDRDGPLELSFGLFAQGGGVRGDSANAIGVQGTSLSEAVRGSLLAGPTGTLLAQGSLGVNSPPYGVFAYGNSGATGTKTFVEPHPSDPSKVIRYVSLEGDEPGTYLRRRATCVGGVARIAIPDHFATVTDSDNLSVQATAVGQLATFAVRKLDLNEVVLQCSRDVDVFVTVNGVRKAFRDFQPVGEGREYLPRSPAEKIPAYLTEEARRRLIANGTYNADGTVNMETAERLGWTKVWSERLRAAAEPSAAERP
ncbi:MAG TPA: hypothetical protein VKJ00_02425 [Thermoanaerobaculia bacterium]|nr:hypothetical protein [Thermoanaerobaculia bacterium]